MSGLRYNVGKLRWGLLSWPAMAETVKVLEFGAKKYAAWNWTKGLSWTGCFESLQRHLQAWYMGEDKDPETGLSHMAHVACNAMFLMHFILTGTGKDDRPVELRGETIDSNDKPEQYTKVTDPNNPSNSTWIESVYCYPPGGNTVVVGGVPDVQTNLCTEAKSR